MARDPVRSVGRAGSTGPWPCAFRLARADALLALALLLASCSSTAQPPPSAAQPASAPAASKPSSGASASTGAAAGTIRLTYPAAGAGIAPLWIATEQGLFKKYGVDVDVQYIQGPADIQALVGGDTQVSDDAGEAVTARLAGADVLYVAVHLPQLVFSLYGPKDISSAKDLIGKTVAASTRGAASDIAMRTYLRHKGIDASQVKFTYVSTQGVLPAMQQGTVQAGMLSPPLTLQARQLGLHEIANITNMKLPSINDAVEVRRDWANQNKTTLLNVLKAYLEAIKIANSNEDAAKAAIAKYTKTSDAAALQEAYDSVKGRWAAYPVVHADVIQNLLDFAVEPSAASHKPSEFYDNSYLESLQDFVKSLYPEGVPSA